MTTREWVRNYVELVALGVVVVVIAFMLGVSVGGNVNPAPDCPTEDSCHIDYVGGEWVVTETP